MTLAAKITLTTKARSLRANGLIGGQNCVKIESFSVGTEGYDPNDDTVALAPDPTAQTLGNEIFGPKPYEGVEWVNSFTPAFICRLEETEAIGKLGELGLWARIMSGPEAGNLYLHAILHFPAYNKIPSEDKTWRILLPN